MKVRITGVDTNTQKSTVLTLDALSVTQAVQIARSRGILPTESKVITAWSMILRWVVILGICFLIAYGIVLAMRGSVEFGGLLIQILGLVLLGALAIFVISAGVRRGMNGSAINRLSAAPPNYTIMPLASAVDGPGKFYISGVDKETKMDTTWRCGAASSANARVKAELEGIIVTSVTRERV